jgi:hypothetical protein
MVTYSTRRKRRTKMKAKMVIVALFVALATMGFDCINDNFLVSVNVKGITGKFRVNRGPGSFDDFATIRASDYLDEDFSSDIKEVRIYDIRVSTQGTFAGNVNSGTVTVNGSPIVSLVGSTAWSAFTTPQSLLTSSYINRNGGGVGVLVNAIKSKLDVTLRGFGSLSGPVTTDSLYVIVEVFAQADATVE